MSIFTDPPATEVPLPLRYKRCLADTLVIHSLDKRADCAARVAMLQDRLQDSDARTDIGRSEKAEIALNIMFEIAKATDDLERAQVQVEAAQALQSALRTAS